MICPNCKKSTFKYFKVILFPFKSVTCPLCSTESRLVHKPFLTIFELAAFFFSGVFVLKNGWSFILLPILVLCICYLLDKNFKYLVKVTEKDKKKYILEIMLLTVCMLFFVVISYELTERNENKLLFKILSNCDIKENFKVKILGRYWKVRGINSTYFDNKLEVAQLLFAINLGYKELCKKEIDSELTLLYKSGYDFKLYRSNIGLIHLHEAIIEQTPFIVDWLLKHEGFLDTVISSPGPYQGQDIFQFAALYHEQVQTKESAVILELINKFKDKR